MKKDNYALNLQLYHLVNGNIAHGEKPLACEIVWTFFQKYFTREANFSVSNKKIRQVLAATTATIAKNHINLMSQSRDR